MSSATHIANDIPKSLISADLAASRKRLDSVWNGIIPGIVLVAMITAVAFSAHNVSGFALFSPMILAVVAGMKFHLIAAAAALLALAGVANAEEHVVQLLTKGDKGSMVALIVVGKPVNLDAAQAVKQVGKAKTVFPTLFAQVTKAN